MVEAWKRPASSLPLQETGEEGALYTLGAGSRGRLGAAWWCTFAVLFKQYALLSPGLMQWALKTERRTHQRIVELIFYLGKCDFLELHTVWKLFVLALKKA